MKKTLLAALALLSGCALRAQISFDVHSHVISPEYIEVVKAHHAELEEGFPLPLWDAEAHLRFMQEAGIDCSVLTMCAPHPHFGDDGEAAATIRRVNEYCAELKRKYPGKFRFCASLPLPNVGAAIREAIYALDTLHADGIKLATNSRGQYLGAPELDTLMQVLHERKAVVVLHPHKPDPYNSELMAQTPLAMQEYLAETTRAVCNMISRNVLARYHGLKVVVPHCGAYMPLAVPRMKSLTPVMQQAHLVGPIDWEANLKALYYDLAGAHSPQAIRAMLTITTPDHILYGSDYPYASEQVLMAGARRMQQYLATDSLLAPYAHLFLRDNAKQLFK